MKSCPYSSIFRWIDTQIGYALPVWLRILAYAHGRASKILTFRTLPLSVGRAPLCPDQSRGQRRGVLNLDFLPAATKRSTRLLESLRSP